jgi:hypothetical protein
MPGGPAWAKLTSGIASGSTSASAAAVLKTLRLIIIGSKPYWLMRDTA